MSDTELKDRIKAMMVESLMLKMEPADDALFSVPDGLAVDSIATFIE